MYMLNYFLSLLSLDSHSRFDIVLIYFFLRQAANADLDGMQINFFSNRRPVFFSLSLYRKYIYPPIRIFKCTEHDDLLDIIMIAGIPEVIYYFFNGCLGKHCIDFIIEYWLHHAGIDVEIVDFLACNSIVFIWVGRVIHDRMSLYLSLFFYAQWNTYCSLGVYEFCRIWVMGWVQWISCWCGLRLFFWIMGWLVFWSTIMRIVGGVGGRLQFLWLFMAAWNWMLLIFWCNY